MARSPIGNRLRQARKARRLSQTSLAAKVGISVSYLNLIEHDKRPIGGALLNRLAGELDLDPEDISGLEDARLTQHLIELAAEPLLRDIPLDDKGARSIVSREPDWARAVARLHNAWRGAGDLVEAMSDQLANDPFMAEAAHEILTLITSIRSFSEILEEHADLSTAQRRRFVSLMARESSRLGDSATALFRFMSARELESRPTSPAAEVEDFLIDRDNYFAEIEVAADDLRRRIAPAGVLSEAALAAYIEKTHGLAVVFGDLDRTPSDHPVSRRQYAVDDAAATLLLRPSLPGPTVRFQLARAVVERECRTLVASMASDRRLTSGDARHRTVHALTRYGAGAVLLPYDAFLAAAEAQRYDIQSLGARFGASFEQVCHRLVTLKRPGARGIPFAFMRSDPAGNSSKRFSLPDLRLPRHGSACPLWALYRAFQSVGQIVSQMVELPDGQRFLTVARTITKEPARFGAPPQMFSVMLACRAAFADRIVYGDGLISPDKARVTEAGISCRLCPRPACPQRAYAQILPPQRRT